MFTNLYNDSPGFVDKYKPSKKKKRENEKDLGIRRRTNK